MVSVANNKGQKARRTAMLWRWIEGMASSLKFWPVQRGALRLGMAAAALVAAGLLNGIHMSRALAAGRHAAMVIDANSGQVLHAQAADEPRYPASLTKMMTIYIVFELMEQGRIAPDTRILVSAEAARVSPSKLGLEPGSQISAMDAVKALITKSANDIAVALAEHVAGTEAKFAQLMTRKAHQLGMSATTFRNAHGLPDSGQITTARDMLTLALRLNDDFPKQYKLFALRSFSYGGATHRNHNTMLDTYKGMDGLKTGYTTPSGFNLVASVRRDGRHIVGAVFGGTTASARNAHMRTILDRALAKAATERTRTPTAIARATRPARNERKPDAVRVAEAPAPVLVEPVRRAVRPAARQAKSDAYQPNPPTVTIAQNRGTDRSTDRSTTVAVKNTDEPAPGTGISIARVRPVMIAPRAVATASPADALSTEGAGPEPEPRLVAFSQPAAAMPPGAGIAMLGAQPSSLQAQASRLERGQAPIVTAAIAPKRPPAPATATAVKPAPSAAGPASAGDSVAIQIGAYQTEAEAHRQLASVKERTRTLLAAASPTTQPVQSSGRQLYRARFIGLDATAAAAACTELRRNQIDCQVTR